MRRLRIILASTVLIASILWLVCGTGMGGFADCSERLQIIPSAIQTCLGVTVFWIVATLLFGRVYCSTVCPVGSLQDMAVWVRRKSGKGKVFRFEKPLTLRYAVLLAYAAALAAGITAVGFVVEPWNMIRNAAAAARPSDIASTWTSIGISTGVGVASGFASLLAIIAWAWFSGRDFCTKVCPIGTALGCVHSQTLLHIAIDPDKCVSCMKCEDACPSKCINVERRFVDNSRCIRCFDCIDVCPNDAVRYQLNKDRHRQTPLLTPS